ncbi:rhodanese-like domain-containing protein [Basfia succiniciproducens]|uniref:sulfurtransferase n=1 Tax=Basfia succiniciproducens TaxID=653940 RepID=UPI003FCE5E72
MNFKLTLIATAVALTLSACDDKSVKEIKTDELLKNLDNPEFVIIDGRSDSLYNGFKDGNAKRGGHIKGAVQFSCNWLAHISDDKFEKFAKDKGLTKDKTLVFYDSNSEQLNCLSDKFAEKGYKVRVFKDYLNYANSDNPLEAFPNFEYSVSPEWVNAVIKGEKPESYQNDDFIVFHVGWGPVEKSEEYKQHIPGAFHFNTDWVENDPVWNLSDPKIIEQNLLNAGINKDKTIILYSDNQLAAYRIFWALKWAGVKDVRVLNGNLTTWTKAGFATETAVNTPTPVSQFGVEIPLNPQINISMPQEAIARQKQGLKLISNRAWDEYTGKISGYSYIPGKGEPQGAIWGFAGTDASNMADYYDVDGTLRNPKEIFALWKEQNINQGDQIAFYCGTGWRAGVSWFMTQLAGWDNAYVYDGGWNAWQMDSVFPVQKGAPNNMAKPDSKNDFGQK